MLIDKRSYRQACSNLPGERGVDARWGCLDDAGADLAVPADQQALWGRPMGRWANDLREGVDRSADFKCAGTLISTSVWTNVRPSTYVYGCSWQGV